MYRAFTSELIKLRRPSVLLASAAIVAFTVAASYLAIRLPSAEGAAGQAMLPHLSASDGPAYLLSHIGILPVALVLVSVAGNLGAEWSQGTIRFLLVREPRRLRWLGGKMLAIVAYVLATVALADALGIGAALVAARQYGLDVSQWTSQAGLNADLRLIPNGALMVIGYASLGMFVAVAVRSATAAVAIALGYAIVAEAVLNVLLPAEASWLPGQSFSALVGDSSSMGYERALVVSVLWMGGFVLASAILFRGRDVTA